MTKVEVMEDCAELDEQMINAGLAFAEDKEHKLRIASSPSYLIRIFPRALSGIFQVIFPVQSMLGRLDWKMPVIP
jgi:hypothetical protein